MSRTRNGKLARLANSLREQLNQRLENGEPGDRLATWLNSLPEVQALLAADFGGEPVSRQNVSRWRRGGYRDWLARRESHSLASQLIAETHAARGENQPPLSETLTQWVAASYTVATRRIVESDDPEAWHLLRQMCGDVVQLRRREQTEKRLELERHRQQAARQRSGPSRSGTPCDGL